MRSIDPVLLSKIKEQNQTIWNNAQPKMSVVVARAKSSIRDSSYFTIETIRTKEGIADVTVTARRMKPIGRPDRIYGIHIDNGVAKTSLREYPDKLKEHWKHQFDVGEAKAVSICFDGRWYMNYKKTWGLQTDEVPWIFWVDLTGKLYARIWESGTTYELATDVVKLDTMRGWIPAQAGHMNDQGIIVAYIKSDGKVYYRNYCLQETGLIIWETEKEVTLFGADCLGIRLFRSNDFRVGLIAEKAAGNIMAVTKRNWAGMSIAPEKLVARVEVEINFILIEKIAFDGIDEYMTANVKVPELALCGVNVPEPTIIATKRVGGNRVVIEFNQTIINYENSESAFTISSKNGVNIYTMSNISASGNNLEIILAENIDPSLDIDIVYDASKAEIKTHVSDYCKRLIEGFTIIAGGQPPIGYLNEYLNATISTDITLTKIEFTNGHNTNVYITASITVTITLWDIDDAPV